ncbi:hypothetical protein [Streptomyces sp. NPDC026092]|uniref:hypothetical protein n=1 Tax=Streptomyces sp. NPDC026092 TaxID=3154797 RepID=UPI0033DA06CB
MTLTEGRRVALTEDLRLTGHATRAMPTTAQGCSASARGGVGGLGAEKVFRP